MGYIHPAVSEICDPQSLDPICGKFDKFLARGQAHMGLAAAPPAKLLLLLANADIAIAKP